MCSMYQPIHPACNGVNHCRRFLCANYCWRCDVVNRAEMFAHHNVQREALSVRERMSDVLAAMRGREFVGFADLFELKEGRAGVVVTFLAMLELIRESLIEFVQSEAFAPIYLKPRNSTQSVDGENITSSDKSS